MMFRRKPFFALGLLMALGESMPLARRPETEPARNWLRPRLNEPVLSDGPATVAGRVEESYRRYVEPESPPDRPAMLRDGTRLCDCVGWCREWEPGEYVAAIAGLIDLRHAKACPNRPDSSLTERRMRAVVQRFVMPMRDAPIVLGLSNCPRCRRAAATLYGQHRVCWRCLAAVVRADRKAAKRATTRRRKRRGW